MAKQRFAVDIDLQKNSLLNTVIQPLASAPGSPVEGLAYYDTTLHQFGVYQNSGWVYLSAASGANVSKAANSAATNTLQVSGGTDKSIADYAPGSAGLIKTTAAGVPSIAVSGTDFAPPTATTSALKGNGSGGFAAATLNDVGAPTAAYSFGSQRITNVADPTAAQEAATRNYVDTQNTSQSTTDRARANHTGTQLAATISDFDTQVRTNRLDQLAAPTAAVSLNGQKITSLADPTNPTDAATKQYVDGAAVGIDFKPSVAVATTANITLSGLQTIDGYTTVANDRVLVKNQTTASANGIYVAASTGWTRSTDADTSAEVTPGMLTYVENGTTQGGQQWILTTTGAITLGTTSLTFTQFSGASTLTAGNGLTASGNSFNVGAGNGISVAADAISVDPAVVSRKYSVTIGDGTTTAFTITHNLNTQDVQVGLRDMSTNEIVEAQVIAATVNTCTVTFNTAPATNAYRVNVQG